MLSCPWQKLQKKSFFFIETTSKTPRRWKHQASWSWPFLSLEGLSSLEATTTRGTPGLHLQRQVALQVRATQKE